MSEERNLNKLSRKIISEKSSYSSRAKDPARWHFRRIVNYNTSSKSADISVHFDDIEDIYVKLISEHSVVVGAVAWLTNKKVLAALATCLRVSIVVQKEDFLREDVGFKNYTDQRNNTRYLYKKLNPFGISDFSETYPGQQDCNPHYNHAAQSCLFNHRGEYQQYNDAIRCIGFSKDRNGREIPRMHHKFLVFGERDEGLIMIPKCIVTGSYNLSQNATRSRENIVVIKDQLICQAYLSEWAQLWSMSEPLDWSSSKPDTGEMYVGT